MFNWLRRKKVPPNPWSDQRADFRPGYFGIETGSYNETVADDFAHRLSTDNIYNWLAERII